MSVSSHSSGGDDPSPFSPSFSFGHRARPGLAALLRAWNYARESDLDVWEFALEIGGLYDLGLTISDLRLLVAKRCAEHGIEVSAYGDPRRAFESGAGLKFEPETCFALTVEGAAFVGGFLDDSEVAGSGETDLSAAIDAADLDSSGDPADDSNFLPLAGRPHWHAARRELFFGEMLVKRFRVPARNQEWILEVFEEDGWPEHIDDPLPPSPDICPKSRLRDAIGRLNRRQVNPLLRFHGNGNGTGLFWELLLPGAGEPA